MGLTVEEFYRLRDDRTNRLTADRGYQQFRARLVADATTVTSFAGQVQLLIAANLLGRWCRQIEFGFPDTDLTAPLRLASARTLHERIMTEVHAADPFGQFGFAVQRSAEVQYERV